VTELLNSFPVADCEGMKPPPANRDASPAPPLSEYIFPSSPPSLSLSLSFLHQSPHCVQKRNTEPRRAEEEDEEGNPRTETQLRQRIEREWRESSGNVFPPIWCKCPRSSQVPLVGCGGRAVPRSQDAGAAIGGASLLHSPHSPCVVLDQEFKPRVQSGPK
jgi:hypothetical protein